MGNFNNKMYQDGDVPRSQMNPIFGPSRGWCYYKCSTEGNCVTCNKKTNHWHLNVKSGGKFLCEKCYSQ